MEKTLRVLKVEPDKLPYVKEIGIELEAQNDEVGGEIAAFDLDDECLVIYNNNGKMENATPNRRYKNDIICGPFLVCGYNDEGDFISITDEQIERYSEVFKEVEQFARYEPELEPRVQVFAW